MSEAHIPSKPSAVRVALFVWAANLVASLAYAFHDYPVFAAYGTFELILGASILIEFGVEIGLIFLVARGFGWARHVLVTLAILLNVGYFALGDDAFAFTPSLENYFVWLSALGSILAIVLLFSAPANTWFRQARFCRLDAR